MTLSTKKLILCQDAYPKHMSFLGGMELLERLMRRHARTATATCPPCSSEGGHLLRRGSSCGCGPLRTLLPPCSPSTRGDAPATASRSQSGVCASVCLHRRTGEAGASLAPLPLGEGPGGEGGHLCVSGERRDSLLWASRRARACARKYAAGLRSGLRSGRRWHRV